MFIRLVIDLFAHLWSTVYR